MENIHKPVMVKEMIESLKPEEEKIYVDATLGDGGHTLALLKSIDEPFEIIAIDRDVEAIERARRRLGEYEDRIEFININFEDIDTVIDDEVDGFIFDLGLSTHQIFAEERGFSFTSEGPLDMGMGLNVKKLDDLINKGSETKISQILYKYGNERFSRRIARSIIKNRPIKSTKQLADLIENCYPKGYRRIHPATRVFQALRIWVNDELDNLGSVLEKVPEKLNKNGKIIVISYHSLEHNIVREKFSNLVSSNRFKWIMKMRKPTRGEVAENKRSRSARLNSILKVT
jgi:16S rRNA (cytosine1402-N4)-methyltransferase